MKILIVEDEPKVVAFLKQGLEVWAGSPQELLRVTREDNARMASVIKAAGIKAD